MRRFVSLTPYTLLRIVNAHLVDVALGVPVMAMNLYYLASADSAAFGVMGNIPLILPVTALAFTVLRTPSVVMMQRKVWKFLLTGHRGIEELEHCLPCFWHDFAWLFPGPSAAIGAIYVLTFCLFLPQAERTWAGASLPYLLSALINCGLSYCTLAVVRAARPSEGTSFPTSQQAVMHQGWPIGRHLVYAQIVGAQALGDSVTGRPVGVEAENKTTCCICLDEYVEGDDLAELVCAHVFHSACINRWILTGVGCPLRCSSAWWPQNSSPRQPGLEQSSRPPPEEDLPEPYQLETLAAI